MLTMLYTMVAYFYPIPELITPLLSTIGQEMLLKEPFRVPMNMMTARVITTILRLLIVFCV